MSTQKQEELHIAIAQTDIVWENPEENLRLTEEKLLGLAPETDLVVLPEMFTTGFSANAIELAESTDGKTMLSVKQWAKQYDAAFIGSFIAKDGTDYFNRAFMVLPSGETHYYDKRHLFIGGEEKMFTPGSERVVVAYKGWNICLAICYDLRFPVWLRNQNLAYDLLVFVNNWPTNRRYIFDHLLIARAIENQSYVCACNRVGKDGNFMKYNGGSQIIDFQGRVRGKCEDHFDGITSFSIEKYPLESNREKMAVWRHADKFNIL